MADLDALLEAAAHSSFLHLAGLRLTSIPPGVFDLANLTRLDLSNNEITVIPSDIGRLKRLEELWLNGNPVTSLPPEIEDCIALRVLDLRETALRKLPSELCRLPELSEILLHSDGGIGGLGLPGPMNSSTAGGLMTLSRLLEGPLVPSLFQSPGAFGMTGGMFGGGAGSTSGSSSPVRGRSFIGDGEAESGDAAAGGGMQRKASFRRLSFAPGVAASAASSSSDGAAGGGAEGQGFSATASLLSPSAAAGAAAAAAAAAASSSSSSAPLHLCSSLRLVSLGGGLPFLKPQLRTAYLEGGTFGLLQYLQGRDARRGLKRTLMSKLQGDIYHEQGTSAEGRAVIQRLVKEVMRAVASPAAQAADPHLTQLRSLIRNAERLFPADPAEATVDKILAGYTVLQREQARKQLAASMELLLRAVYYDKVDPRVLPGHVDRLAAVLPELEDMQFFLSHAKKLLPERIEAMDPQQVWGELQALRQQLAEERAAAEEELKSTLQRLYPEREPSKVAALVASLCAALSPCSANRIRALSAEASEVFPPDWTSVRVKRALHTFEALQKEKGLA